MSKLYATEEGRIMPLLGEELTRWRRARKILHLAASATGGDLYVLAYAHAGCMGPLWVSVNGHEATAVEAVRPGPYLWHRVPLDPALLVDGKNTFDFWTDGSAMTGWAVATEPGHRVPASFVSDDAGATWRNHRMGYLNVGGAEYAVRVRLDEGHDPEPPRMAWEDPLHPRVMHLRSLIPTQAAEPGPLLVRVRVLTAWLSSHRNRPRGGLCSLGR